MASVAKRRKRFIDKTKELAQTRQNKAKEYFGSIRKNGIKYAEELCTIAGKPISFVDFPYVQDVFNDSSPLVVLLWARGMTKTTTISTILSHKLATIPHTSVIASAPRDKQAWRITKEHIRPRFTESRNGILFPLIGTKNTESEIKFVNGSTYLASGSWITGNSLRGPHVNYGFADELQDWTEEAFGILQEVVSLPPGQIFCGGTPKLQGSFFEELWEESDKKEWDAKTQTWNPTNLSADGYISGYHITQEHSPFVTPQQLERKKSKMNPRLYANEVLAEFYMAGGTKPMPPALVKSLLESSHQPYSYIDTAMGVDWGNETRWVLLGKLKSGVIHVISTGIIEDVDTNKHGLIIHELVQKNRAHWIMCDAGYGKSNNQYLMKQYPGQAWSVFTNKTAVLPTFETIKSIKGVPLQQEEWQYYISVNHTIICEDLERLAAAQTIKILSDGNASHLESYMYELAMAEADEIHLTSGKERRFNIKHAHGYAATAYGLIPLMGESTRLLAASQGACYMTTAPASARANWTRRK